MGIRAKQKIINKAIVLFNDKRFASVALFEIARALDRTRGNLMYHFKEKYLKKLGASFDTAISNYRLRDLSKNPNYLRF